MINQLEVAERELKNNDTTTRKDKELKMQRILEAWFDGGCWPNPGKTASYGAVIYQDQNLICQEAKIVIPEGNGLATNNLAEYAGFFAVLEEIIRLNLNQQPITIHGDSNLVIKQMQGKWRIKNGIYAPLALKAKQLTQTFKALSLVWIPREKNTIADALSHKAVLDAGLMCSSCLENDKPYQRWCPCSCHKHDLQGVEDAFSN